MSVAAPPRRLDARRTAARPAPERLAAVLPQVTVFVCLAFLYAWQAWLQRSPWLYFDELSYARLARSIAQTGWTGGLGDEFGSATLYAFVTAPAWLLDDTRHAYEVAKYIGVLLMTATVFPAYLLARTVAPPRPALFAAAASVCIPALSYSSLLMQETLAYPYATLSLFLIVRALSTPTRGRIAAAVAASLVAPLVRVELVVLPLAFAAAALLVLWARSERRYLPGASRVLHWSVAALIAALLALAAHLVAVRVSEQWAVASDSPREIADYALWAAGALFVGVGVLPALAGLTSLVRPRGEKPTPTARAFVALFTTSALGFALYTGGKGAYLASGFGNPIEERNLIYLAPLLFAATALWLARARVNVVAFVAALALVAFAIVHVPYQFNSYPASDAPSLAMLAAASRDLGWGEGRLELALLVVLAFSAAAMLVLPYVLRRRSGVVRAVLAAVAALVLAWNLAGELYASDDSREFGERLELNQPHPLDWVERVTGGTPTLYLGQQIADANKVWMLAFWNPSLTDLWSLDASAGATAIRQAPLPGAEGILLADPEIRYVVADRGIDVAGTVVGENGHWHLFRIRRPLRLRSVVSGVYDDGWMGADASYLRFGEVRRSRLAVTVSRVVWCGLGGSARVDIALVRLEPVPGGALRDAARTVFTHRVASCTERRLVLATPAAPFRVDVHVDPTFVPAQVDPRLGDTRALGAQVSFEPQPAG